MSNIEISVVVEGQTEQTFVRDVLAPEIARKGIYLTATLMGKPGHKGGDIRFERAKRDIGNFLKQRSSTYVSTMFDYFRIETTWPGRDTARQRIQDGIHLSATDKAELLEKETRTSIKEAFPEYDVDRRFIPYIEMHEFEALLFSDAKVLAQVTQIDQRKINAILAAHSNPEEINDDPEGAPSKRLGKLSPAYRKAAMGRTIANSIGIQGIRNQCPHFNDWLTKLECLAP